MSGKSHRVRRGIRLWTACIALLAWAGPVATAQTVQATATRTVEMLELSTQDTGASTYYLSHAAGWGAASCAGATWAYFYSDRNNARELFALLMFAKQMGKQVQLVGTCTSLSYFQVIQVLVAN
jgi:hypothetical protein